MTDGTKLHWGWGIVLGVVSVIGGVIALLRPGMASLAIALIVGWILLFVAVSQVIAAFFSKGWKGFLLTLVGGLIAGLAGILLVWNPLAGVLSLTILLGAYFIVAGIFRAGLAFQLKPESGWVWVLGSAILGGLVGLMILSGLPSTASWVVGTLAGIDFIFSGASMISVAMTGRKLAQAM